MVVKEYIFDELKKKKIIVILIDPDKKQGSEEAGEIAKLAEESGAGFIMVGGSTLESQEQLDETIKAIKRKSKLPVVLFPSSARFISKYADAIFFLTALNSKRLDYIVQEQVKGAAYIKRIGLETISMGYVVVEPGMTVGKLIEADLIKENEEDRAVGYGLITQYQGMEIFYLEAGSGAPKTVPIKMIKAVKKEIEIPLIVGGGINDAETVRKIADAGADIIVISTAFEKDRNKGKEIFQAIK